MSAFPDDEPDNIPDHYEHVGNVIALRRRQRRVEFTVTTTPVRVGDIIAFETVDGSFLEQPLESLEVLWEWEENAEVGREVSVPTEMARGQVRGASRVFRLRSVL